MKTFIFCLMIMGFIFFGFAGPMVSAQTNPNPNVIAIAGVVPLSQLSSACLAATGLNVSSPNNVAEIDAGLDYQTPGQISGGFYDLNNPSTQICGQYTDFCDLINNHLIEFVWGGSPIPGGYPNLAGAVEVDCSTMSPGWTCHPSTLYNTYATPSSPISGYCGPPAPDLVVTQVVPMIANTPYPSLAIWVVNNGDAVAGSFDVYVDLQNMVTGHPYQFTVPAGLAPNTAYSQVIYAPTLSLGQYWTLIETDTNFQVDESDENNNIFSATLTY